MNITIEDAKRLLAEVEAAPGPDRRLDADICVALGYGDLIPDAGGSMTAPIIVKHADGRTYIADAPALTGDLSAALALVKHILPGWMWRVAGCSVSDDAWLAPDLNDPVHGERLAREFPDPNGGDPAEYWLAITDIDRRPAGQPQLALLEALLRALIAVLTDKESRS